MLKFLQEFPEAVLIRVAMESLLDDEEVWSARHNFWSDRWMVIKVLHEFLKAVFLGVTMQSQLDDEDVWSAGLE